MIELICNLHIHSKYSDGTGTFTQIARNAISQNVDVVIITDHNVLVKGLEGYIEKEGRRVLVLTGEEVHDQNRQPQKNHTLVLGCETEMAGYAHDPQLLIDKVNRAGGMSFLAHPFEYPLPLFHEDAITWESWEVDGYTGIELWNNFSEFKTVVRSLPHAIFYAFLPDLIPHQPLPQILNKWDSILALGNHLAAVAGSDAHALQFKWGLFRKTIFPYDYHFSTLNNHLRVPERLSGDLKTDKDMIYNALRSGSSYIANDSLTSPKGFRFTAENERGHIGLGESLSITQGATLKVHLPYRADLKLIHNGKVIQESRKTDHLVCAVNESGAYRVEAYLPYFGKKRGWIFSNPIYLMKLDKTPAHDLK